MLSTDRKLQLQANDIDVSTVSQTTAYWTDLASPVASDDRVFQWVKLLYQRITDNKSYFM